jgi:hypothetical protein
MVEHENLAQVRLLHVVRLIQVGNDATALGELIE